MDLKIYFLNKPALKPKSKITENEIIFNNTP
jgi:hypothetical protein